MGLLFSGRLYETVTQALLGQVIQHSCGTLSCLQKPDLLNHLVSHRSPASCQGLLSLLLGTDPGLSLQQSQIQRGQGSQWVEPILEYSSYLGWGI